MTDADLTGANLTGADLTGANLTGAKINYTTVGYYLACPETGSFVGYKKCKNDVIVKLHIYADAKRSSATTRKCRAEYVKVLDIYGADVGYSNYDDTEYRVGEIVRCHEWDDNRWNECSGGIHFFLTRAEAEAWNG